VLDAKSCIVTSFSFDAVAWTQKVVSQARAHLPGLSVWPSTICMLTLPDLSIVFL